MKNENKIGVQYNHTHVCFNVFFFYCVDHSKIRSAQYFFENCCVKFLMIAFRWNCTSRRQSQPIKGGHWYCTVSTQCVSLPTAANTNSPWEYTRIIFKFNILLRVLDCLCVFCHSPLTAIESTEEASTMFGCHRIFTTLVCIQFAHYKIGFVFIDPIRPVGQLLNVHRTVFPMIEVTVILCYAKVQTKRHTKKKTIQTLKYWSVAWPRPHSHRRIQLTHFTEIGHEVPHRLRFDIFQCNFGLEMLITRRKHQVECKKSQASIAHPTFIPTRCLHIAVCPSFSKTSISIKWNDHCNSCLCARST